MKQTNENISTTSSDFTQCNGHQDELIKIRKDSDNDDAATNTSSSSSSNLNNSGLVSSVPTNTNELIVLPESSFNIRIQSPGLDTFDLPVTSSELVQEIHQVLMDKEETCHRTCFSLQLDGIVLDNFTELKNIENLKEGSLLKVIEEQYTVREVRIHIRHINELIHSCDIIDLYNGNNGYSLCMVNDITNGDIVSNSERKKAAETNGFDFNVPEYLLPNQKDILLTPLFTTNNKSRPLQCLKVLSYSGWNPPNGSRKLHGDLMYLQVTTCEEKSFHITACTKGFYVSQTTDEKFIPKPVQPKAIFHSLVDLLNNISPLFKKNFATIQRKRCTKHPFERIQIPCQIHPWLSPRFDHTIDFFRAEDANINKLGHEDHIPGQVRDWNEELQITKELSKKTLPERLIRERAMFKVHSDFVSAAIRGCQAVVDGNIMAINPGEESKVHMYIWNNMFFSLGFDVKEHYKDFGGDAAAHAAPTNDLQGVRALNTIDLEGLHTLGTAVVDYRGMRVTAQTIPSDAYQFFTTGQQKIQQGLLREGFELISEAHNLLNNVYGPMHPEISMCLRLLARLNYIMGDYQEALYTQHKAVMMSERVLGIDHPQTATEYIHMALYSFANGHSINASKLLCRARYIILACCGENHPQISLIDSNLGLILQSYGDYENALKFMEKSLELNKKFYGLKSLKVALSHHLCARIQSCRGDFRSALNSEREAYQIYKLQLGDEHERTRESAQVLQHLTEQAVVLQKRMNDVVKGQLLMIPSITIQQPSFQNVLEMLNVVNGILFIQIREKDLDLLREELAKQSIDDQQQQASISSIKTISETAEQAAALMDNEVD
ncbi:unnamed protein product [Rotaria sp. Silwood2]|nr:unnamed protein product [Rotaria sp. Silwood2]